MKSKGITIIMLLFCGCLAASAQGLNGFKSEFAIGGSFSANFSSLSIRPKVPQGQLMTFSGGTTFRWITEKHLGLIAELNYARQGWSEDFSEYAENDYKYSRTLNYIELPFLTHIYFGSERVRFFINLGPKIAYLLSESTDENLNGATPHPNANAQHNMPAENKLDWGLCGGPGVELRTGIGSFMLEGRYYYGLGNIYGNKKEDVFAISSPQVMTVKLTYLFTILKK